MRTQQKAHNTDDVDIQDLVASYATTPAELARKREVIERINRLREEIGPIDIHADDLLHLAENEDER